MIWEVILRMENGLVLKGEYEDLDAVMEMVVGLNKLFGLSKVELTKIRKVKKHGRETN